MTLALTQPLTDMNTRYIHTHTGCKGGRCIRLTNLPLSYADCLEIRGPPSLLEPYGPVEAGNGIASCIVYICNDAVIRYIVCNV